MPVTRRLVNGGFRCCRATADGTYLAAAEEAAAHNTAVHVNDGVVNIAVGHIAAAEDVARCLQTVLALQRVAVSPVVYLLDVAAVEAGARVGSVVTTLAAVEAVAYVAVVDGDVGLTEDGAALAATIDAADDAGDAAQVAHTVAVAVNPLAEILGSVLIADGHMGMAVDVAAHDVVRPHGIWCRGAVADGHVALSIG